MCNEREFLQEMVQKRKYLKIDNWIWVTLYLCTNLAAVINYGKISDQRLQTHLIKPHSALPKKKTTYHKYFFRGTRMRLPNSTQYLKKCLIIYEKCSRTEYNIHLQSKGFEISGSFPQTSGRIARDAIIKLINQINDICKQ